MTGVWLPPLPAPVHRPVEDLERPCLGQFDRVAAGGGVDDGHVADQVALAAVDLEVAQGVRNVELLAQRRDGVEERLDRSAGRPQ